MKNALCLRNQLKKERNSEKVKGLNMRKQGLGAVGGVILVKYSSFSYIKNGSITLNKDQIVNLMNNCFVKLFILKIIQIAKYMSLKVR